MRNATIGAHTKSGIYGLTEAAMGQRPCIVWYSNNNSENEISRKKKKNNKNNKKQKSKLMRAKRCLPAAYMNKSVSNVI